MTDPVSAIIFIVILLFSVIFHEVAHGIAAERLGDPTARYAGRLTLNPIPHIDPIGSILLPLLLKLTGAPFLFGYAKPVPVDYRNLLNFKRDMAIVALAGPFTNLVLAALAGFTFRILPASDKAQEMILLTVGLNLALMIFNLIPIPPLDGSKALASIFGFFSDELMNRFLALERIGIIFVFLFMYLAVYTNILSIVFIPAVILFRLFTGVDISVVF